MSRLAVKARALPRAPGVYLMKDEGGVVLYVGKATCLPNRVSSYFVPSAAGPGGGLGPRKQAMLALIHDFDVVTCESEWEALLAENRLIKDLHPRFNERLTDGKSFPYLVITMRDAFPGVFVTREPNNPQYRGARVYGPFTSVYALRESAQLLQRVFRFRTCTLDIRADDDDRRFFRPCLLYPIKQCTGPCADRISREAYRADIDRFIRFLDSKRSVMLKEMQAEMAAAAEGLAFERAAVVRDQIRALEKLDDRGRRSEGWQPEIESFPIDPRKGMASLQRELGMEEPIRCIECIDIAHLQGGETVGAKVCFIDGRPLKNEYRRYRIRTAANDDCAAIREVVGRRYRGAGAGQELYPDLIIIDGGLGQLHAALEAFDQLDTKPPMVIALAKKEEVLHVQARAEPLRLSRHHNGLRLCQAIRDEAHRFAQHYHHVLRRKRTVGEQTPKRQGARPRDANADQENGAGGDGSVEVA